MQDILQSALKGSRADYTEIRLEEREATTVSYRGKDLENASAVIDTGGIVRAMCRDGGWGIATFNARDDLSAKVEQAYQCAKSHQNHQVAHSESPIELAPVQTIEDKITIPLAHDFRRVSLAEKKSLIEGYNALLLHHSNKIVDTVAHYGDTFSRIFYANSEGTFIEEERPMVTVYIVAITRDGDNVQQASESRSGQKGFDFVQGLEDLAQTAAKRAVDLLSAEIVVGGQYPVVLDPALAGVFIHEAFGHLSESDFVYENPKAQEMMVLGRRFGKDILTVFDDGSLPGLRGTHKYDDEGTPTGRSELIKNGILVGRLHSRETAAKLSEKPTGNARATSYRYPPIVRMTNTAIENGTTSFEDMIKDIKLGVYACDAYGGQTALENFSFSSAYAYMIRDGQVAEMVKDVILAGNLFTTLQNIDVIGNDFTWSEAGGMCGKGQSGLPVTFGAPHIRIQNVVIGGK
ncbi:MAG: TldD/PmbA family protein [Anaerolineae bacterium]|nr:TldD/PmbA family protein [Anaerolineae bacterium]